jgi:hypothetical protein
VMISSGYRERADNPMEVNPGNSVEIKPTVRYDTGDLIYYLRKIRIS